MQEDGEPASDSTLVPGAAAVATARDATALKLMVIWDRHGDNERRLALVRSFVELAHDHDLVAITEGIVPADPDGTPAGADELLEVTAALSEGADLYKAQVPIHGGPATIDVERLSLEMTASSCRALGRPVEWCPAGALRRARRRRVSWRRLGLPRRPGDLAIRGRPADPKAHLEREGSERLRELIEVVDAEARPWQEAVA